MYSIVIHTQHMRSNVRLVFPRTSPTVTEHTYVHGAFSIQTSWSGFSHKLRDEGRIEFIYLPGFDAKYREIAANSLRRDMSGPSVEACSCAVHLNSIAMTELEDTAFL